MILRHPMQEIKDELLNILQVIPKNSKIYFLEYPVYENIGDLLIMKGAEQFFQDNNIQVLKRYSYTNFPDNLHIPEDCIIVFQGGGNFGDLYKGPQQLREYVVRRYPQHRIVILPQTIFFKDKSKQAMTLNLFAQHKDLHFFARDRRSFNDLSKYLKNVYLSPDMAHQLWPIQNNHDLEKNITLYHLRTDDETNFAYSEYEKKINIESIDWPKLLNKREHRTVKLFVKLHKLTKIVGGASIVQKLWYKYADYLIQKAVKLFEGHNRIVTSRLHGHILACLMDKNHVLLDNSYGKNSGYYNVWTNRVKSVELKEASIKHA
jgi:pyruvyl transferase EpsO